MIIEKKKKNGYFMLMFTSGDIVKVLTEEELKEMECFFVQSDSQIDNQND